MYLYIYTYIYLYIYYMRKPHLEWIWASAAAMLLTIRFKSTLSTGTGTDIAPPTPRISLARFRSTLPLSITICPPDAVVLLDRMWMKCLFRLLPHIL
jgi:hypothetical protein